MRLALVVVEEHARRTVHLRHDHTFGAVHDEGAVRCHQGGHVAHEDVLLLDVLDRLRAGVLVHIKDDQAQGDLQRSRIGQVALLAFLDVELGRFQLVFHELEHGGFVEVLDREDRLEHGVDALAVHRLGLVAGVQEEVIGTFLNLDQVRHLQHFADFAVVLTQAFLAKIGLRHKVITFHVSPEPPAAGSSATPRTRWEKRTNSRKPAQGFPPVREPFPGEGGSGGVWPPLSKTGSAGPGFLRAQPVHMSRRAARKRKA